MRYVKLDRNDVFNRNDILTIKNMMEWFLDLIGVGGT